MSISKEQVLEIAALARIKVKPDEIEHYQQQLSKILEYMAKLNELDTSKVQPFTHPLELTNVFREDKVRPSLKTEEALQNAPKTNGPYFSVPKAVHK
ncbi:MAG TPA: Asp-tRNA(Asn)/Glu-tRNA(Gln) amidotransferase subunit GatC [Caldithrix abyssi]|uniref:Aspartyl/glutamyl-tRNA(Asn/Gln) amidotransferase subunit C n=1 Tax=Caldithrix abyssi TaxID=187145 RepID=A0A7V5UFY7_CALAY|nr:Asp-tRNA(Asn)/Glu-tRNA(Gln) amidotransferase subunit GatC [Caldithrix abyssi]